MFNLRSTPGRALEASRIATDGTPIDATPIRIEANEAVHSTAAGFDGSNHVIAWFGHAPDDRQSDQRIMASRVTPEGTVLDPEGIVLDEGGEFMDMARLDMVAGGDRSVVVWSTSQNYVRADPISVVELAADGTTSLHPADELTSGIEATLAMSPDGGLLLWRDGDSPASPHTPIVGTRFDATRTPLVDSVVTPAAITNQQLPIAAAGGEQGFFVLWTDTRYPTGEGPALVGARLALDGTPLDETPMQLTDFVTDQAGVVFDGLNYVVAWTDEDYRVVIERVSPAGERLGVVELEAELYNPSEFLPAASDGMHTLLLGSFDWPNLVGALLLDQSGAVVGDAIRIYDDAPGGGTEVAYDARVAFDGSNYLVVWHDESTIFGQRISQAGALEGQRFAIVEDYGIEHVAIASGAGNHLVTWETYDDFRATRVGPDGQLHDVGALDTDGVSWCCNSVAFDGQSFIVAWRGLAEEWEDEYYEEELDHDFHDVLYGTQVSPEGEVLQQFLISPSELGEEDQQLAVGGDGQVLVLYSAFVPELPYNARRLWARRITP